MPKDLVLNGEITLVMIVHTSWLHISMMKYAHNHQNKMPNKHTSMPESFDKMFFSILLN